MSAASLQLIVYTVRPSLPVLSTNANEDYNPRPTHLSLPMTNFTSRGHVLVETPAPLSRFETRRSDPNTLSPEPHSPEYHMHAAIQALQQPSARKQCEFHSQLSIDGIIILPCFHQGPGCPKESFEGVDDFLERSFDEYIRYCERTVAHTNA